MKKINIIATVLLSISVLGACSNLHSNSNSSSYKSSSLKAKKAKESSKKKAESIKKAKEESKKKASESKKKASESKASESVAATSSQQIIQQQDPNTYQEQPSAPIKSQSQINMEHGYDPKGNPVMPGSDHAPGSDVYGNSDDWVRGQTEWLKSHSATDTSQYNDPEIVQPEAYHDEQ